MKQMTEEKLLQVFSKAFHEVAPPLLEDLKVDIKENMATKDDIFRLESKLDRHEKTLDDHEKWIKSLETS